MLDCVLDRRANSRLSCQIVVKNDLDGLVVRVADEQI
jgi:ferredoxin